MPTKKELEAENKALKARVEELEADFHWEKMQHDFCKKELEKCSDGGKTNHLNSFRIKQLMYVMYSEFRSTGMNKKKARDAANDEAFRTGLIKKKYKDRWLIEHLKDGIHRNDFFEVTGIWLEY